MRRWRARPSGGSAQTGARSSRGWATTAAGDGAAGAAAGGAGAGGRLSHDNDRSAEGGEEGGGVEGRFIGGRTCPRRRQGKTSGGGRQAYLVPGEAGSAAGLLQAASSHRWPAGQLVGACPAGTAGAGHW